MTKVTAGRIAFEVTASNLKDIPNGSTPARLPVLFINLLVTLADAPKLSAFAGVGLLCGKSGSVSRMFVHYAECNEVTVMIDREKQIKSWRRKKKIDLIEKTNPRWEDLAQDWGRKDELKGESLERNS
jgi:hypothetical protein